MPRRSISELHTVELAENDLGAKVEGESGGSPNEERIRTSVRHSLVGAASGGKSARGSLVGEKRRSMTTLKLEDFPAEVRGELKVFDADGDGTIDKTEIVQAARTYARQRERAKQYRCGAALMLLALLVLSCVSFLSSLLAVTASHQTDVSDDGILYVRGSTNPVRVASAAISTELSSHLPNEAFDELSYFTASTSRAHVRVDVLGYSRLPAQHCLPPIVELVTAVGKIYIEGSQLEFAGADVDPFFARAGFTTMQSAMGRRRLSQVTLIGFFNTLEGIVAAAEEEGRCVPHLPQLPSRMQTMSKEAVLCGDQCMSFDSPSFELPNLVGVSRNAGRLFRTSTTSTLTVTSEIMGENVTKSKTISTFPRYPNVFVHDVNNGSHSMRWIQHDLNKYQCTTEINDEQTSDATIPMSNTTALLPDIRYEGFTLFSNERYTNVGLNPDTCLQFCTYA